jgi:hypothetical protein
MIQLEKYHGTKSRHTCPACNSKNCFVRYQDERGEYLSQDVGRCNRESKCGYHYKPKQFFADNPNISGEFKTRSNKPKKRGSSNYGFAVKEATSIDVAENNAPDFIPFEDFKATLSNYDQNNFVQFLFELFPDCIDEIQSVLKMYFVGTYLDWRGNYTCLPSIDRLNRVCRAKLIRFNKDNGKRLKGEFDTSSLPAMLKLKDFNYKQIFFGEHLLSKYPNKPVAVCEAEKTAIIASLCFPEFVWLGCNSKTWLKSERLQRLGQRQIILYPDADGFALWQEIAFEGQRQGLTVKVSKIIESQATAEQKTGGYDLADYLINQQHELNELNELSNSYNAKLETVLSDEKLQSDFQIIIDEQLSILMIDGNLSRMEAETITNAPNNLRRIIQTL